MPDVYKAKIHDGYLVAFWKSDANTLSFFVPSRFGDAYFSHSTEDWNAVRDGYTSRGAMDFDSYDDLINAAWHYIGQRMVWIDKRSVVLSSVKPGVYYPRIWRGHDPEGNPLTAYNAVNIRSQYGYRYTQSAVAAASLFDQLVEIFKHVEPSTNNYLTYGHKMRELLLLACTEIESEWRSVLEENTRKDKWQERYTTVDYFRVKEPLRLGEWSVILTDYAHLGVFTPFEKWSEAAPTKSLAWYDAYNAVKHHREAEFPKATLENLLNAMAALHIMQVAQWGPEVFSLLHENRFSPFSLAHSPDIAISDVYIPSIDESRSLSPGLYFEP
jgi:hypothetical protein